MWLASLNSSITNHIFHITRSVHIQPPGCTLFLHFLLETFCQHRDDLVEVTDDAEVSG